MILVTTLQLHGVKITKERIRALFTLGNWIDHPGSNLLITLLSKMPIVNSVLVSILYVIFKSKHLYEKLFPISNWHYVI